MARANNAALKKRHVVRASNPEPNKNPAAPASNAVLKEEHIVRANSPAPILPKGKPVSPLGESMVDRLLRETRNRLLHSK